MLSALCEYFCLVTDHAVDIAEFAQELEHHFGEGY